MILESRVFIWKKPRCGHEVNNIPRNVSIINEQAVILWTCIQPSLAWHIQSSCILKCHYSNWGYLATLRSTTFFEVTNAISSRNIHLVPSNVTLQLSMWQLKRRWGHNKCEVVKALKARVFQASNITLRRAWEGERLTSNWWCALAVRSDQQKVDRVVSTGQAGGSTKP